MQTHKTHIDFTSMVFGHTYYFSGNYLKNYPKDTNKPSPAHGPLQKFELVKVGSSSLLVSTISC